MVAVVMRRNGDRDAHSYLLGVWRFYEGAAQRAGWKEHRERGHKYEPEFCIIDDKTGYVKERWIGDRRHTKEEKQV